MLSLYYLFLLRSLQGTKFLHGIFGTQADPGIVVPKSEFIIGMKQKNKINSRQRLFTSDSSVCLLVSKNNINKNTGNCCYK